MKSSMFRLVALTGGVFAAAIAASAATVMIECESFKEKGGWVVDQQFMDQMGSPFLLAHGLGKPVADAVGTVSVPGKGAYRVWARTRNWTASWSPKASAAGRFALLVNGKALASELGGGSAAWQWQEAGKAELAAGETTVALHDLTGFDGRCDAVLLSSDAGFVPPADVAAVGALRRKLGVLTRARDDVNADLVVVGGGMAGICTAISAARLGLKVALVQDRPLLGGCNSMDVRVLLGGKVHLPPYPRLGDVGAEVGPILGKERPEALAYIGASRTARIATEPNVSFFLNTHVTGVETNGGRIAAVIGRNIETGVETRYAAPLFADCTGDGSIGALAGAEFRYGRESRAETGEQTAVEKADSMTMGASIMWSSKAVGAPVAFPVLDWALPLTDKSCENVTWGGWNWETGMNLDQVADFERVRDYGLLAIYSNWSFIKNRSHRKSAFANRELDWVPYVSGKRESRRLVGDVILDQHDLVDRVAYPDATASTSWNIDLHYPEPRNSKCFPGQEFKSIAKHIPQKPYPIPYRCLYSKNIGNLFMAGRDISVTHVALGTVRVMRTGGMLGEVVGMAASICKKYGCLPRGVYADHLDELKVLMTQGVGRQSRSVLPDGDTAETKVKEVKKQIF